MRQKALQNLADAFRSLPGIGPKMAERLAFHLLKAPEVQSKTLIEAISSLRKSLRFCDLCGNISESEKCEICADGRRDGGVLLVVEDALDIPVIEKSGAFSGVYHVLGGALSPLSGIGPGDLRVAQLFSRVKKGGIREVIIGTNPTIEGESTASYIASGLNPLGVKVSRLAYGLPMGMELQYADEFTLKHALSGRTPVNNGEAH